MLRPLVGIVFLVAMLVCRAAYGDTFRCGSRIVTQSTSAADLVKFCGAPTTKSITDTEPRGTTLSGNSRPLPKFRTEVWFYDRGSQSFGMRVTIVEGKITRMETVK